MAKQVLPEKGTSIEVFLGASESAEGHFMAEVVEETERGIVLSGFEGGEREFVPPTDSALRVRFHLKDSGYEFDTIVLNRAEKPYPLCYIAKPLSVTRRQMRAYLRVDCELPVTVIRQDDRRRNVLSGVITNISGGGCVVSMTSSIPQEVLLELKFNLDEHNTVDNIVGRILTVRAADGAAKHHVIQFEAIDDAMRTKIVRYSFRKQHALKSKTDKPEASAQ